MRYRINGRRVVGLCSNDYLGLADEVLAIRSPAGAGGSRLICGDLEAHRDVERSLATLVGTDDAVLFPSGYQLNLGVIPALIEHEDLVWSDALNHASLIDGLRLARARVSVLDHRASPAPTASVGEVASWWITESIFSMDGDLADVGAMRRHLEDGGALYVDEAHAFGLYSHGRGLLGEHGLVPTAMVGTLGKSYGVAGAFVAASSGVCSWIRSRARSFVFSTGMSPVLVAQIAAAIARVQGAEGDERRARVWLAARHLAQRLGLDSAPSPIFPIVIGDNATAVAIADALLDRGWHVQPIRPPTVPDGTARLRVTVSAGHDLASLDAFAQDLLSLLERAKIPLAIARGLGSPDRILEGPAR